MRIHPEHGSLNIQDSSTLATLILCEREALLTQWRERLRQLYLLQHHGTPRLNGQACILIDQFAGALQSAGATFQSNQSSQNMVQIENESDIAGIITEFSILRGCIYDFIEDNGSSADGTIFHILNRVFDKAMAETLQTLITQQALEAQRRRHEYLRFLIHDLRTPLNAISLAIKVLELTPADLAKTTQMLEILGRNVQRMESLLEKVPKEDAHIGTGTGVLQCRPQNLWQLVESLIHDLRPVAETSDTKLINRIPQRMTAYADADMLKRILQNLMAKAVKYTPNGDVIIGSDRCETGGIECWVSSNGTHPENIFDTPEPGDDTKGLGFPIVKKLVESHGGKVSVRHKEGIGNLFHFTLPGKETP